MKRNLLLSLMFLACAGFASAQIYAPSTDVLGAHLNYGRGCAGCHAPHSGAYGAGNAKTADGASGSSILWGEDVASLVGQTLNFAGNRPEVLPSMTGTTPDVNGLLTCLSCHDGNYATGAMMQNKVLETLPPTYGTYNKVPTLLGNDSNGNSLGNYLNDHPAGLDAKFGCNSTTAGTYTESGPGKYNWDCVLTTTGSGTTASFAIAAGPNMATFINNYGFFVSLGNNAGTPVVVCTTCHNQHLMNVVAVSNGTGLGTATPTPYAQGASVSSGMSGLPAGSYATMFFIRAPYNVANRNAGSNQAAQFCRQCHGGESNEMNGSTAVTQF